MKILSFPFSFNPSQSTQFNTYEAGEDDYKAQQVEAFMRTHKTVRPIFKDFGVEDPTFGSGRATRSASIGCCVLPQQLAADWSC